MPLDPRRIPSSSQIDAARAKGFQQRLARLERGGAVSTLAAHASTHHYQDGSDPLSAGMVGAYTKAEVDALLAAIPTGGGQGRAVSFFLGGG